MTASTPFTPSPRKMASPHTSTCIVPHKVHALGFRWVAVHRGRAVPASLVFRSPQALVEYASNQATTTVPTPYLHRIQSSLGGEHGPFILIVIYHHCYSKRDAIAISVANDLTVTCLGAGREGWVARANLRFCPLVLEGITRWRTLGHNQSLPSVNAVFKRNKMATLHWQRDIGSDIAGVKNTFSGWDQCMAKAYWYVVMNAKRTITCD